MTSTYYISPVGEQDIDEVISYLAQENPLAAHSFLDALYSSMQNLADNPHLGHFREDLTNKPVKFFLFKWHYLIIYKPVSPVEIVRVLSGYRDLVHLIV